MSRFAETSTNPNGDVLALLTMLSNPDDLKKKLEELQEREKALDEKIALVGEVDQILTMKSNAENLLAFATNEVEQAKLKAQTIVDTAQQEANLIKIQADNQRLLVEEECANLRKQAEDAMQKQMANFETTKNSVFAEIQRQEDELAKARQELEERANEVATLENESAKQKIALNEKENSLAVKEKNLNAQQKDLNNWFYDLRDFNDKYEKDLARIAR